MLCRVCQTTISAPPLLEYRNLPAAAQHLPTAPGTAGIDLRVVQCPGCALVQLDAEPVPYYREVIRAAAYSPEMGRFRHRQFRAFLTRHQLLGKEVLEIGCGRGEYLRLMAAAGARVSGIEGGRETADLARQDGFDVHNIYLETGQENIPGAPYAAFFVLNWLEHLPNLPRVLNGIHANLQPQGIGLVEVPNFDMILQNRMFAEFTADHLFYFTRATLRRTLENHGFDVIRDRVVWHNYVISAEVRKRLPLEVSGFAAAQQELIRQIHAFTGRFQPREVAVWGAGHQAFAIMALARLGNRVRAVMDSAPFKQGKFTPASDLPIVSPDLLDDTSIKAVLVMAGSYSDEIVRLIRRRREDTVAVAVLQDANLEILP